MKCCGKCKEEKNESEFNIDRRRAKDGLSYLCKNCLKIYHRKYYEINREKILADAKEYNRVNEKIAKERCRKYGLNNMEKIKAIRELNKQVGKGAIVRQPCEKCGKENAQAHHPNYDFPLEVSWLCITHHRREHVRLRELQQ